MFFHVKFVTAKQKKLQNSKNDLNDFEISAKEMVLEDNKRRELTYIQLFA